MLILSILISYIHLSYNIHIFIYVSTINIITIYVEGGSAGVQCHVCSGEENICTNHEDGGVVQKCSQDVSTCLVGKKSNSFCSSLEIKHNTILLQKILQSFCTSFFILNCLCSLNHKTFKIFTKY